jgi:hypothetical protein
MLEGIDKLFLVHLYHVFHHVDEGYTIRTLDIVGIEDGTTMGNNEAAVGLAKAVKEGFEAVDLLLPGFIVPLKNTDDTSFPLVMLERLFLLRLGAVVGGGSRAGRGVAANRAAGKGSRIHFN